MDVDLVVRAVVAQERIMEHHPPPVQPVRCLSEQVAILLGFEAVASPSHGRRRDRHGARAHRGHGQDDQEPSQHPSLLVGAAAYRSQGSW